MSGRAAEAVAVATLGGLFGGVFAGFAGSLVDARTGFAVAGAVVGVLNGGFAGARRIYDWSSSHGPVAFTLDSTWALPVTAGGVLAAAYSSLRSGSGYVAELSERRNRQVHRRGFVLRSGFAVTVGNYVGGAGAVENDGRRLLVTDHEDVHVWQARWFGPLYPVLLGAWWVVAAPAGLVVWLVRGREPSLGRVVETCGYYCNPFEWWAYSRHGRWRPSKMVAGLGWRRPIVRPLAEARALRAGRAGRTARR